MARAIDKDKLITSLAWHDQQGMISTIDDILDIIDAFPTLTPPNEPLTLEEIKNSYNTPSWYQDLLSGMGYWNDCRVFDKLDNVSEFRNTADYGEEDT